MSDVNTLRLVGKALAIFLALNLAYAIVSPPVEQLSVYNWLVKGRQRLPIERGKAAHNVTVHDLDSAFGSHVIAGEPANGELRVIVLGDSQTWGPQLPASQTLVGELNRAGLFACDRHLQFYNLAYPQPSAIKDFLILSQSLKYKPDLVIWMLTENSFLRRSMPPVIGRSSSEGAAADILRRYRLERFADLVESSPSFWDRTLIGERRNLATLMQLQLDGPAWDATGIDYAPDKKYRALSVHLSASKKYYDFSPPRLPIESMTFDVLKAAREMVRDLPLIIVNEPMYLPPGDNLDIRYNDAYPRWAYDQYRKLLSERALEQGWGYLDLYDLVPYTEFTNSEFHLTVQGEQKLAKALEPAILSMKCP